MLNVHFVFDLIAASCSGGLTFLLSRGVLARGLERVFLWFVEPVGQWRGYSGVIYFGRAGRRDPVCRGRQGVAGAGWIDGGVVCACVHDFHCDRALGLLFHGA